MEKIYNFVKEFCQKNGMHIKLNDIELHISFSDDIIWISYGLMKNRISPYWSLKEFKELLDECK